MSPTPPPRPGRRRGLARRVGLVAIGIVTATPAVAVAVPTDLARQYALDVSDPTTVALLQHRGGLQAVLGLALIAAAWRQAWTVPACLAAILTKGLFLALVLGNPDVRAGFPAAPLAFDAVAVIALAAIAAGEIAAGRAGTAYGRRSTAT